MAMDDFSVTMAARRFVQLENPSEIPAPVEAYVKRAGAVLKIDMHLGVDEPGWSFEHKGKKYICVNGTDSPERQRFTICHEIAHIQLGLPSDHKGVVSKTYAKPLPEILCDVYAAELLLPYKLFKPLADKADIGFAAVDDLASSFVASSMATGSRFATVLKAPCAFVISENGRVRYAARSSALRDANAWITPRIEIPQRSLSAKIRAGAEPDSPEEIDADEWFQEWERGGTLLEEARHLKTWDQTLTLLWFEDEEVPALKRETWDGAANTDAENQELLKELDGVLRWKPRR
jgi:hypothetical protein